MMKYYKRILRHCEESVAITLRNQVIDEESREFGGIFDVEQGQAVPKSGVQMNPIILYYHKDSKYYHNKDLFKRIVMMLDFTENNLRPDGTMDLYDCNFFSAPDTGFAVIQYGRVYTVLDRYADDENGEYLKKRIFNLIKTCAYGIVNGGFHTPNHRWVITAALALSYRITGIEAFKETVERYMVEGIDCNQDGEFAERSSGIYNVVNDNALIVMAEELNREDLLEYVKRNLDMMIAYFEPDGSIFTMNSTRQDKAEKVYPDHYFWLYVYMAYRYNDKKFAGIAKRIMDNNIACGRCAPDCLLMFMLYPEWLEYKLDEFKLPAYFNRYFKDSGVVRIIKDNMSLSLLKNSANFMFAQVGSLSCFMRMGISFFNERHLIVQDIRDTDEGYELIYRAQGNYYLPFEEAPSTSDWWKMDHSKRNTTEPILLEITIGVKEVDNGFSLDFVTSGCDKVPIKFEMGFTEAMTVSGESFICPAEAGGKVVVKSGDVRVDNGKDAFIIGPAFAKNSFIKGKFGSIPPSAQHFTVYFTDLTNFNRTLLIKKTNSSF